MKPLVRMVVGAALLFPFPMRANAEVVTKTVTMDGSQGQPYTLDELGAVLAVTNNEIKVMFVMDPESRPKGYQDVDLRTDDQILMANGKKVTTLDVLKSTLDSVKVGADVQLAVKRDKDMLMVHYPKADPKSLPKMKTMTVTSTGAGPTHTSFSEGGPEEEVIVLDGAGVLVKTEAKQLKVMHLLPRAAEIESLHGLAVGDLVLKLQGKSASDLTALQKAWREIQIGAPVDLVCSREGAEHQYHFTKLEPAKEPGGVFITK